MYRVEKDVTFPSEFTQPPGVWGRRTTRGYDSFGVQTGIGACWAVPGSVTEGGARLRTYVYKVRHLITNLDAGRFPCAPENVRFDYTVHGIEDHLSPTTFVLTPDGGESVQAGGSTSIEWHVADEYLPGVRCMILLDLDIGGNTAVWMVAQDRPVDANGNGYYNWAIPGGQPGGSTYKIRVIASDTNDHQGVDASNAYFTVLPWSGKGGPPPPPDPCQMPCATAAAQSADVPYRLAAGEPESV